MDKKSNITTNRLVLKQENSLLFKSSKSEKRSVAWKSYKRAALLQHPLLVESLKAWWNVMDPHDLDFPYSFEEGTRGHLSKEQYMDLNVRLQKALNDNFSQEEACKSAEEDWRVDVQDWGKDQSSEPLFTFDKFLDFFYDIAEEWSIRSILILINALLLHLTVGVHLNTSVFKDVDEVMPLPNSVFKELQRPASDSEDFAGWYKKHFGNLKAEQQGVCTALFRAFPGEARVKDIWLGEVTDSHNENLLQCIQRLENTLNKIEQPPVNALLHSRLKRPTKVQVSAPERDKPLPVLLHKPVEMENRPEPIQLYNRTVFQKEVKLAMVGQSFIGESRQETMNERKEVSVQIRARIPGHRVITNVQAVEKRIVFTRSKSVIYDPEIESFHRKVQTPQFAIRDAEYSPQLRYTRADVKFHRLGKDWRSGKFFRETVALPQPELGYVNERSSEVVMSDKQKRAREIIYGRENIHSEEKNPPFGPAGIGEMIDMRTPLPLRENLEALHTSPIQIEVKKVDVPVKRKTGYESVKPTVHSGVRGMNFENYGHLIQKKRPKKVEFNDTFEFLCHLNRAKRDFNLKHRSVYLRNTDPNKLEYISRRDELGGYISDREWNKFINRLERLIKVTRRKRRLRRNRRRKRKQIRGRLFRNVFIRKSRRDEREEYLKKMDESVVYNTRGLSLGLQKIVEDSESQTQKNKPVATSVVRTHSPARYRPI